MKYLIMSLFLISLITVTLWCDAWASPVPPSGENVKSAFYIAICNDRDELVANMLDKDYSLIHTKYSDGNTALHCAATHGSLKSGRILISRQADLEARTSQNLTPLHLAIQHNCPGQFGIFKLLVDSGASIEAGDQLGDVPLVMALYRGKVKESIYLIKKGAKVNVRHNDGYSLFDLLTVGKLPDKDALEVARLLIEKKADINATEKNHLTCLFRLPSSGLAAFFIHHGADMSARDQSGMTPLFYAVSHNRCDLVNVFVKNGAQINVRDEMGRTPLFCATSLVMVKQLIKLGARVDVLTDDGNSLLHNAFNGEISSFYIKQGARVDARNKADMTPLHCANAECTKVLLAQGADVNAKATGCMTPLHYADTAECARILIEHGADINAVNTQGATPLVFTGYEKVAALLIEKGANIHIRDHKGNTALHTQRDHRISILLMNKGIAVNVKNNEGQTALFMAVKSGNYGKTEALLKNGACLDTMSISEARQSGNREIIALLEKFKKEKTMKVYKMVILGVVPGCIVFLIFLVRKRKKP